jgi:hypothetical protein
VCVSLSLSLSFCHLHDPWLNMEQS